MKRQHHSLPDVVIDEDAMTPKRDLPTHSITATAEHEVLHKASLLNVDAYSMSEVLRYVPLASVLFFCLVGNRRFSALLKSSVTRLCSAKLGHLGAANVKPHVGINKLITNSYFPNLREFYQCLPFRGGGALSHPHHQSLALKVTVLPTCLTKLVLKGAVIRLEDIINTNVNHLASLNTLVLDCVQVIPIAPGQVCAPEVLGCWIESVVRVANHLETLTYLRSDAYDQFNAEFTANLIPKSLTALSMDASVIHAVKPENWHPSLESLSIQLVLSPNANSTFDIDNRNTFTIPPTVTRLNLSSQCVHNNAVNTYISRGFCLTHPSQLTHLTIKLGSDPNLLLEVISKLTCLKYLKLRWNYGRSLVVKYALLPRSLTFLDVYVPIDECEWKHLPPGLQFQSFFSGYPIFHIWIHHDVSSLLHLPKTILEVQSDGRPLPVVLPNLKSVVLNDVPAASLFRHTCDAYLINLPPCLTSLYVSANSNTHMFWLHDHGNDSTRFSLRFPNLMQFELSIRTTLSAAINEETNLVAWFDHLPKTLSTLSVSLRVKPSIKLPVPPKCPALHVIDLRQIRLPCLLDYFEFMCSSQTLILPRVVPASLKRLHARALDMRVSSDVAETLRRSIPDCDLDIGGIRFPISAIATMSDDDDIVLPSNTTD